MDENNTNPAMDPMTEEKKKEEGMPVEGTPETPSEESAA